MIGVGIIGAGFFGEKHARAIADVPGLRLVAAARRNREALDEFSGRFGVRGYTDYRELIAAVDIDAVVIATPHHEHRNIAVYAARAGKHILLEKPMADSLPACDEIIREVTESDSKLLVGHISHFARSYQSAKKLIDSAEIGRA